MPAWPFRGGKQFKPFSDNDIAQIYKTALRILAEIGMAELPPDLMKKALDSGASVNSIGRLRYTASMIEDIIDGACRIFVMIDPGIDEGIRQRYRIFD